MRVVFRADVSVTIGTGHVMRCLTLADALRARGAECRFVTRALPGHLGAVIEDRGFDVALLPAPDGPAPTGPPDHAGWAGVSWEQDLAETRNAMAAADWLIVDHYAFDARWQRGLADRAARIMVIDDLADRPHAASVLLDQNLGRAATDYDRLVPEACRRLIGPEHALLRPEFAALRATALARRKGAGLAHLMISMGGMDVADATSTVLRALAGADLPPDLRISVVMGSHAPALAHVRDLATRIPWPTEVLVDVKDMASLMADADLAIGAGGGTTWERCCLGLPGIIVETAANQAGGVAAMEKAGAALGTGPLSDPAFGNRLVAALGQAQRTRDDLSSRAAGICDGQGASRVAEVLATTRLSVRLARPDDAENIWRWRNDGAASAFYLNPNPTPLADHLVWFENALNSPERDMLVIELFGTPVAHVRLDQIEGSPDKANVSIYLNPDFRGRNLASQVLGAAVSSTFAQSVGCFRAQVHVDNIPSLRAFQRAGFCLTEQHGNYASFEYIMKSENARGNSMANEGRSL